VSELNVSGERADAERATKGVSPGSLKEDPTAGGKQWGSLSLYQANDILTISVMAVYRRSTVFAKP
jgi:hypothetical protein